MKKMYMMLIAASVAVTALAQQAHPQNAIGNNTTAVGVALSDFEAVHRGNTVHLSWTATGESNMASHAIERSTNGSEFRTIGTIVAQNGAAPYKYTFIDAAPNQGNNYYRLRTLDRRGNSSLSSIKQLNNGFGKMDFRVMPNPVRNGVMNVQLSNFESGKYNFALYSSSGQVVFTRSLDYSEGSANATINLPRDLGSGMYFLHVTNGSTRLNKQVLIQ